MHRGQGIKVAFLTAYNRSRASSRVRVYDYLPYLSGMGFRCKILPFPRELRIFNKYWYVIRIFMLAYKADVVVLQKLVLQERFIDMLRAINPRIIFDFDDALWAPPDIQYRNPKVQERYRLLTKRLNYILSYAVRVVVGSQYLAMYAASFAPHVDVIPSSVDPKRYPLKDHRNARPAVLGWIGSPENLVDFKPIIPVLRRIVGDNVKVKIVSSAAPNLDGVPAEFESWKLGNDIEHLHGFDIGLMPLNDTERSRGRCGFKAVQYMAVGLPVVASNVGAAREVIVHGETGFLASSEDEWYDYLVRLIPDHELRKRLGWEGRKRVECYFNLEVNAVRWADILREVARVK